MGNMMRREFLALLAAGASVPLCLRSAEAAGRSEIDADVRVAMRELQEIGPGTRLLLRRSVAVLMFPKIVKGGLIVGGQYGEGALLVHGRTTGYFSIASASFGLQAGGQAFSYALLYLHPSALDYLLRNDGWSIGSGPSVVILDAGGAASATNVTVTQDVVAIPFAAKGLMAGIDLEGSKVTRISR